MMNEEPKLTEGDKGRVRVFCTMLNIPVPEWAMSDMDKLCKGTARGGKPEKSNTTADITRLSKLAAEHGMSYGKYVAKYGK